MVDISSGDKKINITVSTSGNKASVNATPDTAMYYSNKSREWAISDKIVDGEDYSSKYYANVSKQNADKSNVTFENLTTNYNQYKNELENTKNISVEEIETAKTNAISDITNQENLSVDNINTAGETQVNLAKEQATIAIKQAGIATAKTSEVVESGNAAITAITEQETTSRNNIETKGTEQIELIQNEGATQVANVQSTGETEYNKIIATGIDGRLSKNMITNCLLEVPQRIKYALVDGTLTIKAGSVVIVPYGTEDLSSTYPVDSTFLHSNYKVYDRQFANGKFFVWAELVNDVSTNNAWGGIASGYSYLALSNNIIVSAENARFASGDTEPTIGGIIGLWYDTVNNYCKRWNGTDFTTLGFGSFPLMAIEFSVLTGTQYLIGSVPQVFNGMGYIGSTIWVDKGVKGLKPNGRNADGTLNNTEIITTGVTTRTLNNTGSGDRYVGFHPNITWTSVATYSYDEEKNMTLSAGTAWSACVLGRMQFTNGVITSFQPKQAFRATDWNDVKDLIDCEIAKPQISLDDDLPSNCVWLEGATVSRTAYSKLFAIYGTTYGEGDGSTTFVLPDFRNRAIWGASDYGYLSAGLPNIAGSFLQSVIDYQNTPALANFDGAFHQNGSTSKRRPAINGQDSTGYKVEFHASRYNSIYGNSNTVQPPAIKVRVYTRYQ